MSFVSFSTGHGRSRFSIEGPSNIRLPLTVPREPYYMQATANRPAVRKNRPLGIATIEYTAGQRGGSDLNTSAARFAAAWADARHRR